MAINSGVLPLGGKTNMATALTSISCLLAWSMEAGVRFLDSLHSDL